MPTKIAPPSRPERRSPSRAPFASSTANERPIASSAARNTAAQNRPGRRDRQRRAVGVEREREHHHHDAAERQDLLRARRASAARSAGPCPRRATPRGRRSCARLRPGAGRGRRAGGPVGAAPRAPGPAAIRTSRVASCRATSSSCDASSTVRPSDGRGAHDLVEHRRGPARRARRAARRAARGADRARARSRARRAAAVPARAGCARRRATRCEAEAFERGVGIGDRTAGGARSRTGCSRARSGRRSRRSRDRRARASGGSRAGRPRDRRRAPRPCPDRSGNSPAHSRSSVVLPAPFAPASSTISPASTSRSAPASAGNRPSMQTADRRCTTRKRAAPGDGERYRESVRRAPGRRRNAIRGAARATDPAQVPSTVVRRTIAAIGRMLVTVGLLILLFVTYELWGTGIFTARAQTRAEEPVPQGAAPGARRQPGRDGPDHDSQARPTSTRRPRTTVNPEVRGRAAGGRDRRRDRHQEDRRRLDRSARACSSPTSRKGPGHYPGHTAPGPDRQRRDRRPPHDARRALLQRQRARARRPDPDHARSRARTPTSCPRRRSPWTRPTTAWSPTPPTPSSRSRAATRATPRGSASSSRRSSLRKLSDKPHAPRPTSTARRSLRHRATQLATGLQGESNSDRPSLLWGFIVAIVGALWWWAFRRWRHPLTWVIGVIPFLVVLFPFYVYLERALPNGY